jgi:hypothetical protein
MALTLDGRAIVQLDRVLERDRDAMPLCEAATRRLGVDCWFIRLDAAGRVRSVVVLGPDVPDAVRDPPPEPASPAPPAMPPKGPRDGAPDDPLERLEPLPAGGVLARLVGAPQATGRQLADLALHADDPDIRGEAVGVAVDAIVRDPALERRVLSGLDGMDDATLARNLRGIAGEAAAGLLSIVVERARGRPLGDRAARLHAHLGP